jgi:hypothetical protein
LYERETGDSYEGKAHLQSVKEEDSEEADGSEEDNEGNENDHAGRKRSRVEH